MLNSTSYHRNLSIFLIGLTDQKVSCDYSCGRSGYGLDSYAEALTPNETVSGYRVFKERIKVK